ncbi:MAG TPA: peroxiredoxin [Wenzhouxiangella sp.]|nr:peroxiredoxin [Wenzhouxiangella sp.]
MTNTDIQLTSPELEATGKSPVKLDDFAGQPLVLYFYPRDNTPGCTTQGKDFRDLHDEFAKLNCRIAGVSRDTLKSHQRFAEKHDFPFTLIADPDETLSNQFGVMKDKNMFGRQVRGIERSTFLFDKNGRLVREWRKVRVPGHVEDVLEAVRQLS